MADIKVSEMQSATSLNPDDLIMVVQSGSNKKATFDLFKEIPIDNLNSTSTTDALSANQGKILNDKILGLNIPSVVDNLTSTSTTNALSANQGKILNNSITNTNSKITNLTTYSTNEVKTGETWIDGKPIYRKTFSLNNRLLAPNNPINHNISNLGTVVSVQGILKDTDTFITFPYLYDTVNAMYLKVTATQIITAVPTGGALSFTASPNRTFYCIIEYTKTTD